MFNNITNALGKALASAKTTEQNRAQSYQQSFYNDINQFMENGVSAADYNNQFNAAQAQLTRDWQQAMSSTAHQREVADLKKAGINPILSAYSSGSSTPSGATASADTSITSMFGSLANSALSAVTSLASTLATNETSRANAITSAAANKYASDQSYKASVYGSKLSYKAAKYASDNSYNAAITTAMINGDTSRDVARITGLNNQQIAMINGQWNYKVTQMAKKYDLSIANLNTFVQTNGQLLNYLSNAADRSNAVKIADKNNAAAMARTQLQVTGSVASNIIDDLTNIFGSSQKSLKNLGKGASKKGISTGKGGKGLSGADFGRIQQFNLYHKF